MRGVGSATTRTSAATARRGTTAAAMTTQADRLRAAGWVELPLRPLGWTPLMSEDGRLMFECGECGRYSIGTPTGRCRHGVPARGRGYGVWW